MPKATVYEYGNAWTGKHDVHCAAHARERCSGEVLDSIDVYEG